MKEDEEKAAYILSFGLYPGILIGFRSYQRSDGYIHVLYLPFIDISLTIIN